jgi:hypothetical protein
LDGDLISIEDGDLLCFLTTALVLCAMTELVRTRLAALPKLAMSGGPGSSGPVHAHLERHVEGSGYHLVMRTRARLPAAEAVHAAAAAGASHGGPDALPTASHSANGSCTRWVIVETFPSLALFDPDEVRHLQRLHKLAGVSGILTVGPAEWEKPAESSRQAMLLVSGQLHADGDMLHLSSSVPFHLRYAAARLGGGFYGGMLPHPQLFVHCHAADLDGLQWTRAPRCPPCELENLAGVHGGASCWDATGQLNAGVLTPCGRWYAVDVIAGGAEPHVQVPVADVAHIWIVVAATMAAMLLATLTLFWQAMYRTPRWRGH